MLAVKDLKVVRGSFVVTINDLYIGDSECVALCGVSGSGKSTVLEALGLLTPSFETERFILDQIEVNRLSEKEANALRVSAIGVMPQSGGMLPYLTIRDNLVLQITLALRQQTHAVKTMDVTSAHVDSAASVCSCDDESKLQFSRDLVSSGNFDLERLMIASDSYDAHEAGTEHPPGYCSSAQDYLARVDPDILVHKLKIVNEQNREKVQQYLEDLKPYIEKLQLEPYLDHMPHELSIGQRQRALFLRAIAHKPRLLLVDEPTSSLDPDNAFSLFALIDDIAHHAHISVLLVTHDLKAAARYRRYVYDRAGSYSEHSLFVPHVENVMPREWNSEFDLLMQNAMDFPASAHMGTWKDQELIKSRAGCSVNDQDKGVFRSDSPGTELYQASADALGLSDHITGGVDEVQLSHYDQDGRSCSVEGLTGRFMQRVVMSEGSDNDEKVEQKRKVAALMKKLQFRMADGFSYYTTPPDRLAKLQAEFTACSKPVQDSNKLSQSSGDNLSCRNSGCKATVRGKAPNKQGA